MELEIFHEQMCVGSANVARDGLYWNIDARCEVFGSDVYRLWVHTSQCSVRLGVLMPSGKEFRLTKRIPVSAVSIDKQCVISTDEMTMPRFCGTVGQYSPKDAYLFERDGKRTLCIAYRDEPFLLMEYICFFRLEGYGGKLFWMAELDDGNFPVFC